MSPESAVKGGELMFATFLLDTTSMCKTIVNSENKNDGEGDAECIWHLEGSDLTI